MSHAAQLEFVHNVKSLFPEMFSGQRVLEIGSLDINGSIRSFFSVCEYTGLDIAPGKGVDVVCEGQTYAAPDASFDVVISCEVMEHNPFWPATLANMIRLLRPGGLMVMSCASIGRPEHGTARSQPNASPFTVEQGWNYYRNLSKWKITRTVDLTPLSAWGFATNWEAWDLYFLAVKAGGSSNDALRIAEFRALYKHRFLAFAYRKFCRLAANPSRLRNVASRL